MWEGVHVAVGLKDVVGERVRLKVRVEVSPKGGKEGGEKKTAKKKTEWMHLGVCHRKSIVVK